VVCRPGTGPKPSGVQHSNTSSPGLAMRSYRTGEWHSSAKMIADDHRHLAPVLPLCNSLSFEYGTAPHRSHACMSSIWPGRALTLAGPSIANASSPPLTRCPVPHHLWLVFPFAVLPVSSPFNNECTCPPTPISQCPLLALSIAPQPATFYAESLNIKMAPQHYVHT
jgi:hypothetical protein